jgi:hypothetical protein
VGRAHRTMKTTWDWVHKLARGTCYELPAAWLVGWAQSASAHGEARAGWSPGVVGAHVDLVGGTRGGDALACQETVFGDVPISRFRLSGWHHQAWPGRATRPGEGLAGETRFASGPRMHLLYGLQCVPVNPSDGCAPLLQMVETGRPRSLWTRALSYSESESGVIVTATKPWIVR